MLIPVFFLVDCWRFIYKHHRSFFVLLELYVSVISRGTKSHWVNPWTILCRLLVVNLYSSQKPFAFIGFLDKHWPKGQQVPLVYDNPLGIR